MKNLSFYLIALLVLSSCDKDENHILENPTVVLKVKKVDNEYISTYFYGSNGFVDSISMISDYGGISNNFYKKFIYNSNDELIKIKIYQQDLFDYDNQIPIDETTIFYDEFEYTNHLITKTIHKNESGVTLGETLYNYNSEDNLMLNNSVYDGEKLIEFFDNDRNVLIKFSYDNKFNPYYFIYPKAYLKINNFTKNNISKITYLFNNGQIYEDVKTLKYNNDYFCTYTGISFDNQLGDYNQRTYFFY